MIYPTFMDLGLSESRLMDQNFGPDCRFWFSFTNNKSINHLFLGVTDFDPCSFVATMIHAKLGHPPGEVCTK
jgi:hypothetical protein